VALDIAVGALAILIVSALLTGLMRNLALTHSVLDIPKDRSSHSTPMPRGGGLAIVTTQLAVTAALGAAGKMTPQLMVALLAGGAAIAVVGFADDKWGVAPSVRLAVHFAAIAGFVWSIGHLPPINFGIAVFDLGIVGTALAIVFLVWFLNLYNFMDGIDGIASVEAISIAAVAAFLLELRGADASAILLLLSLIAAVGGFLIWNWPPARIFMGDVGSGFLGFALGAIAWATVVGGDLSIWVWLILFGAFFVDATITLLRRWARGEPLATAHRTHAYQHLSRRTGSHLKVTLGCLAVNLLWLAPLAWLAFARPSLGALLTLVAWIPLALFDWHYGAGTPGD
jgi:Fuc2NAc and GlcNAc transferase